MKFLPLALAAFAVGADALLTNPVKNVQKVQVYVVVVAIVLVKSQISICICNGHSEHSFYQLSVLNIPWFYSSSQSSKDSRHKRHQNS